MIDTEDAYINTSVFVTGADGFIGSHLVEKLVLSGARVKALVHYNSWNSIGWLNDLPKEVLSSVNIVKGDVRDVNLTQDLVRGVDFVFHLASLIAIPYSYAAPQSYVDTNITGTLNMLQACRANDCLQCFIHLSTSEVYGSAQTIPISESHPLVGQSPYSASKIGADKIVESFIHSYEFPAVVARPFNTYGPRQTARAVIPTIASQLLFGAEYLRLGAVEPTRDFNYVKDTVAGILAIGASKNALGKTINIGTGYEWSIGETAEILMQITNRSIEIVCDDKRLRPEGSEVNRLVADNSKLKLVSGWSPEVHFRDGLEQTVEWIRKNHQHFDPSSFGY